MKNLSKASSKNSLSLQIFFEKLILFETLEISVHSFKLQTTWNTTAVIFYKNNYLCGESYSGESVRNAAL